VQIYKTITEIQIIRVSFVLLVTLVPSFEFRIPGSGWSLSRGAGDFAL